jgi:uncharacterized protein (TIGR03000 family)
MGNGGGVIHGNRAGFSGTGTAHVVPFNGRGFGHPANNFNRGFARGRGWYGYGWGWPYGFGYGLGYGLGYGGFGGYGGYGGYGYDVPIYVPYFSSSYIAPVPASGYGPDFGGNIPVPGPQLPQGSDGRITTASVEVYLPNKDAELWFNGVKTQQTGQKREFITPELQPGKSYTYEVRARWMEDGKQYDQTRTVTVRSGAQVVFAFYADKKEQLPVPVEVQQ